MLTDQLSIDEITIYKWREARQLQEEAVPAYKKEQEDWTASTLLNR